MEARAGSVLRVDSRASLVLMQSDLVLMQSALVLMQSAHHPPPVMHCRVSELEAALAAADAERASQRQQLARLKQQMLSEQEDEEDKIR